MGPRFCSAPHVVRCLRDRRVGLPARRRAPAVAALRRAIRGSRARRRAGSLAGTAPGAQVRRRLRRERSHPETYLVDCLVHACVRILAQTLTFSASWDNAVAPCVLLQCVRRVDAAARFVRARQCRRECVFVARRCCRLDRCVAAPRGVRCEFPSVFACAALCAPHAFCLAGSNALCGRCDACGTCARAWHRRDLRVSPVGVYPFFVVSVRALCWTLTSPPGCQYQASSLSPIGCALSVRD